MNTYTWEFAKKADKEFSKLDKQIQIRIIKWLDMHIEASNNPRAWGKALEGDLGTLWRYRIGKYRLIADIHDDKFVVVILKSSKRNDIYKN
ncbi:type II toxin-antitoxin system RelE family toxin [Companilactobacillus insicii]|uniref:type II toxin-antitoxin system RelE family toxin n=1 Tax=Companilactobacillus insicii TaxID=1732567 RepID=UPI000F76A415|nr:type II toxin-antitoxin system RelE/ParE family toxin [Companilactobacillus insicii]